MAMDPQVRQFLDQLAAENPPGWETMSPAEARDTFLKFGELFGPREDVADVADRTVANSVRVRVYSPDGNGPFPVVMYFHGGGWVIGDLETHDPLCRRLCNRSGCAVVAVDYRRAPEHKYPAALHDCFNATKYVAEHAAEFNADPRRIAVAGDSAGGNLAAAVTLKARDEQGPPIRYQLLIYPITDRDFETESYRQFAEGFGLTRAAMKWFWQCYLARESDGRQPLASPLSADLSGLPGACVVTAEYDVLRDEGRAYAEKLSDAGVDARHMHCEGVIHGFFHFCGLFDRGKAAIDELGQLLRRELGD